MPAGWYHAQGDPPGTSRYWDGSYWIGEPQAVTHDIMGAPIAGAPIAPYASYAAADPYTGVGERMAGRVIDVIILWIPVTVLSIGQTMGSGIVGFGVALFAAILPFIWDLLWVKLAGGTPGKLLMGARVFVEQTGERADWYHAAMRAANRILVGVMGVGTYVLAGNPFEGAGDVGGIGSGIGSVIAGLIGLASLVMLSTDEKRRTVMDRMAGTVVMDVRR